MHTLNSFSLNQNENGKSPSGANGLTLSSHAPTMYPSLSKVTFLMLQTGWLYPDPSLIQKDFVKGFHSPVNAAYIMYATITITMIPTAMLTFEINRFFMSKTISHVTLSYIRLLYKIKHINNLLLRKDGIKINNYNKSWYVKMRIRAKRIKKRNSESIISTRCIDHNTD